MTRISSVCCANFLLGFSICMEVGGCIRLPPAKKFSSKKYILVIFRYTTFQPSNLKMYSSWIHFPEILGSVMIEKVKSNSSCPFSFLLLNFLILCCRMKKPLKQPKKQKIQIKTLITVCCKVSS